MSGCRAVVDLLAWTYECACMRAALMTSNGVTCGQYVFILGPSPQLQHRHTV